MDGELWFPYLILTFRSLKNRLYCSFSQWDKCKANEGSEYSAGPTASLLNDTLHVGPLLSSAVLLEAPLDMEDRRFG